STIGQLISDLKGSRWNFKRRMRAAYRAHAMLSLLEERATVSAIEWQEFNPRTRNEWIAGRARSVGPGSSVLDVGAGTDLYRDMFKHCTYETQDFAEYDGYKGLEGQYAHIDHVSDITKIPVPDASFDVILCTEVLEHVPRPIDALREMARIAKP